MRTRSGSASRAGSRSRSIPSGAWLLVLAGLLLGATCVRPLRFPLAPLNLRAAIAVDASGNQVLVGTFAGRLQIGDTVVESAGGTDIFVSKNKPDETPAWPPLRFGGAGDDEGTGVSVDADGSIVLVGTFQDALTLGTQVLRATLRSPALLGVFVAKLDPTGKLLWARQIATVDAPSPISVAVRPDHNIVVGASLVRPSSRVNKNDAPQSGVGGGASWALEVLDPNGVPIGKPGSTEQAWALTIGCGHSPCITGSALNGFCDLCVGSICGLDPFCCNNSWDGVCVGEVASICGQRCDCNDKCKVGLPFNPYACPCVGSVCGRDPYCMRTAWDAICVGEVHTLCAITCPP